MRIAGFVSACVGLAMLLGGCDTTDSRYFRHGIGTDLYSADIVETTQYQDLYLTELCRQALPLVSTSDAQCLNGVPSSTGWNLIVQAGMNDVDRRCDGYLAWLDDRRRTNNAVLKELGDATVAAQGIMRVAGVGANPITLAGLAFGFAANTFTNINSRLLLEVDKTTVQTLVLRRRDQFRLDMARKNISDRPTAVHALRLYLTICTPYAIETDINSTVTVFQQAGGAALDRSSPLVNSDTVSAPLQPREVIRMPERSAIVAHPEFSDILDPYDPKTQSTAFVSSLQRDLCVPRSEQGTIGRLTKAMIRIYEASAPRTAAKKNGKLDAREIAQVQSQGGCVAGGARNYFESVTYGKNADETEAVGQLIDALKKVPGTAQISSNTLDGARDKIQQARGVPEIAAKLSLQLPPELSNQVTRDFLLALPR
jgi:hypothetical protein